MLRLSLLAAGFLAASASPALAHVSAEHGSGLVSGFSHPVGGLDHVLAMVAVGILASQIGGRAIWLVPAAFLVMMVNGGLLGMYGVPLPYVELGIVGSVVILGAVIAIGRLLPVAVAMALVGGLAIFHGHAHGTEMPAETSGLLYALGFVAATALLHAVGVILPMELKKVAAKITPTVVRAAGGVIAAAGLYLFVA
ncbi:MAG: HupE/UreJ family protein [Rhodospirillaceae bacterium]